MFGILLAAVLGTGCMVAALAVAVLDVIEAWR